jgi:D-alanyl-D-alanine carboxypeptidase
MKKIFIALVVIAVGCLGWFVFTSRQDKQTGSQSDANGFNKSERSLDEPSSLWVIANKQRPLQPTSYVPNDLVAPEVALRLSAESEEMLLRTAAANALEELFAAAKADGLDMMLASAYRSYSYQEGLYNTYVKKQGQSVADTQSARPGYSEHQTGLAADIEPASRECEIEACFGDLPEGKWLAEHAHEYGFVIRYPQGKADITGYIYEPWHLRYVGKELATEVKNQDVATLEEFFGLPPAADYR